MKRIAQEAGYKNARIEIKEVRNEEEDGRRKGIGKMILRSKER